MCYLLSTVQKPETLILVMHITLKETITYAWFYVEPSSTCVLYPTRLNRQWVALGMLNLFMCFNFYLSTLF